MTGDRTTEEGFFQAGRTGGGGPTDEPPPPPRRESPLLRRSPAFAAVVLAISGWLLSTLWTDLSYFFSPLQPIDLGGQGSYRLEAARENRLVQARGELTEVVSVAEGRKGVTRTIGRLAGTNLLVDRPGRSGPPLYEGRLLPAAAREKYGEVVQILRGRGAPLQGDGWRVLRDGERPRRQWTPVLGAALLLAVIGLNLRALLRSIFTTRERR
jgi:hypothetical protein